MNLFGFLNYIYIYIIAIFFSYCQEFTIKPGAFKFIDGNTLYNNNNNIKVKKGTIFLNNILQHLEYKKVKGFGELSSKNVVEKISGILGDNGFFLAKDKGTGNLSIVGVQDGFQECHANCEFIIRDKFFDRGVISYASWHYFIDKDYKRNFLEIVLKYANGDFKDWKEFSKALRNFISKVLEDGKLTAQNNEIGQLKKMETFVGKNDKFYFDLFCDCENFSNSGSRPIIDIKKFLTEVDRDNFVEKGLYGLFDYLVIFIGDPKKLEFYSSYQDYALKPVSYNIYICNFFDYNEKLNSAGIKKLLKGNDYDMFQQDAELSFGKYLYKINVKTKDQKYVDKRPKGKLKFVISNPNILQFVKDKKMLEDKEYYLDEIDNILRPFGSSIVYDKSKFKDKVTFEIKIVKPIAGKVEYVKKNVKFELDWNLKEICGLKTDEKTVKKEFQIDAISTLKSVLDVFFKQLNGLVKNAENIRPESYDVFASDGKKIDPAKYEEYKILKDENFTIKLDIFDEKYFEKKNCSRKLTIQIGGYKEKKGGITYIKVPKDDKFVTFFSDESNNEELLKKMLKEELQKKVFINSKNIKFGDFSTNKDFVELSIKNLEKEDIKETKFVTTIKAEAPKNFRSREYICFDYSINKDSTLDDAIKDISKFIKEKYEYSTAPVFESIKYGDGDFYIIDNNKNKITPCKDITLKFKADGKINEDYISEQFPVVKFVNIELRQDNNYFALKKDVDDIIREISPVYLHYDATCNDFLEKVTKQLRDKTEATNPPSLSFKEKKIILNDSVNPVVSDKLCLYLDPFKSGEYVEKNKNFEGVYLYFKLRCGVDNYKLKNDYNNRDIALVVKDINNGKVTFKDLKKALEENYGIKSDQCNIYVNDNRELKDEDIISVTNFVVGITDSSLLDYLTPLEKMTFTIDYKYDTGFYKLTNYAPKELIVLITEEDLNKNIHSFISDHIITTIKNQNKDISYIYSYSLNNNKSSYDSNEKVKDCIEKDGKNIVVLQLFEGCNLLESKEKNKKEELNKEKNKEEKPKEEPKEKLKEKLKEKKEEIKEEKKEKNKKEELKKDKTKENKNIENKTKEKKSEVETTLKDKGMKTPTPEEKSKEKPVGEPGKKSGKTTLKWESMKNRTPGKTTLKSGDVKNSTEVKKGCCNNKCCKSKEEVESTEKKGCCCSRN